MGVAVAFFGFLLLSLAAGQSIEITPRDAVRRPGDDVKILCKVAYPIDSCRIQVGSTWYRLRPTVREGDVIYHGQGLANGECGAHIRNIKEEQNGNVSCTLPPQSGNIEVSETMSLVVARAPKPPQLIAPNLQTFREGDYLMAVCTAPEGRPAANITWLIDDQPLLNGVYKPVITSEPNSDLQTISQNVSRLLTAEEDNRRLVCRVEHIALSQPLYAAKMINVHYPPKGLETGTITIFGLKIGAEGRLNVTVRSNPPPRVEWTVADQKLTPSRSNADGTVMALEPVGLGGGFYNVSLKLSAVQKEDVDRTYYLYVSNELGDENFAVRLSTLDEPAGVELGSGAIAGIVIAVLIVLIAVLLTVFAKATDRWCFGAARRRETKGSGESTPAGDVLLESRVAQTKTDTESAAGTRPERSRLAELTARVRAVLPRSKDKVQAAGGNGDSDEKPLSEDKKGIVYAELSLNEGARDKAAPASAEYAEIVYTNNPPETAPPPVPEAKDK